MVFFVPSASCMPTRVRSSDRRQGLVDLAAAPYHAVAVSGDELQGGCGARGRSDPLVFLVPDVACVATRRGTLGIDRGHSDDDDAAQPPASTNREQPRSAAERG